MRIINRLIINVSFIIILGILFTNKINSQTNNSIEEGSATEKAMQIVEDELIAQGIELINYYISLAKEGNSEELSKQFAQREAIKNPNNQDDLAEYVVPVTNETDEERLAEQIEFFLTLDSDCGNKSKVRFGDMSDTGEPIGHAFRLTFPGKIQDLENKICYQHSVSFRRTIEGKLLIREWFSDISNRDCLEE